MLSSAHSAVAEMREALATLLSSSPHTFNHNSQPCSMPPGAASPIKSSPLGNGAVGASPTAKSSNTTPQPLSQRGAGKGEADIRERGDGALDGLEGVNGCVEAEADGHSKECKDEDLFQVGTLEHKLLCPRNISRT